MSGRGAFYNRGPPPRDRRYDERPRDDKPRRPRIDRERTCPMLVRIFVNLGSHHKPSDYADPEHLPEGLQVTLHTWMDSDLREIADLVRVHLPEARRGRGPVVSSASAAATVGDASSSAAADVDGANATSSSSAGSAGHASIAVGAQAPRLHICLVYPDREGRHVLKDLGMVDAVREGIDDLVTLAEAQFQAGDFLDVAVL